MDESDGDPYFRIVDIAAPPVAIRSQHVYDVIDFSSQYGTENTISYTASNVIGKPNVYPRPVDSTSCYQMRTYGQWWNCLPSAQFVRFSCVLPVGMHTRSDDFLEIKFEERVYPTALDIYEIFNPGAVIRISGYCYEMQRWKQLWHGKPETCSPDQPRIFSPKFKKADFKTNCFRLEFYHRHLHYYYELDSIVLWGSTVHSQDDSDDTIVSRTSSMSVRRDTSKDEDVPVAAGSFGKLPVRAVSSACRKQLTAVLLAERTNEVMLLIFSFLDLKSLCAASQVSSWFKKLCYDPILYRVLDLQPYWNQVSPDMLDGLSGRCSSLQSLNLSWCGSRNLLTPKYFVKFVEIGFTSLTCLKLSNCAFVNNHVLRTVATCCRSLQVLELRSCRSQDLNHAGFSHISLLENLVYLDLYRTAVDKYSICLVVKSCSKLEHLLLGGCYNIMHFNDVVQEIGKYLSRVKTLDLWRARSLTEVGVFILSEQCQELVELDLGWCLAVNVNSGCLRQLVRNCVKLKKLFITAIRTVSDTELLTAAYCCRDLEQLDILGTREITFLGVEGILQNCSKLKLLDVSFCQNITEDAYEELKAAFPHVQIKRSQHPE